MKNLLLLFFCSFLLFQCSDGIAQTKKGQVNNDLKSQNPNAKIKSIKIDEYDATDTSGILEKGRLFRTKYSKYDIKGNKIDTGEFLYELDKIKNHGTFYCYDSNENLIEERMYFSNNKTFTKTTFKYNLKGILIESKSYLSDIDSCISFYKYNKGYLFQKDTKCSFDSAFFKETYKYDRKGNKRMFKRYNSKGGVSTKEITKYNRMGKQIKTFDYKLDGSLYSKEFVKYDLYGHKIKDKSFQSDYSSGQTFIYTYDIKGYLVEFDFYDNDLNFVYKYIRKYDDTGNIIEENWYGQYTGHYTFNYEFDKFGNWIKCILYMEENSGIISERHIEYY